ncbi:MAG: hypothetical protein E2576_01580 [Alcaligenaceae bacterium]|nr:hypothetical protein [Alcaligenaceae bacterium SAGV5]MPS53173.1 hypothetical protein [Alcaligenaceae bacterium SAGV3]MPT55389.1 hypothetical protein [Alcaligenaceae bacterium]
MDAVFRDAIADGVGTYVEIDKRQIHLPAEVLRGEQPAASAEPLAMDALTARRVLEVPCDDLSRAPVPFDDPLDGPVLRRLDAAIDAAMQHTTPLVDQDAADISPQPAADKPQGDQNDHHGAENQQHSLDRGNPIMPSRGFVGAIEHGQVQVEDHASRIPQAGSPLREGGE